nr:MAG TPA: hypothetical protein [Caudoviricetes sp.]
MRESQSQDRAEQTVGSIVCSIICGSISDIRSTLTTLSISSECSEILE